LKLCKDHEDLCVDIYSAILQGTYSEAAFRDRVRQVRAELTAMRNTNPVAAAKLSEILDGILSLAKCKPYSRKWRRTIESIERKQGVANQWLTS
jgi:hypothetical protein